jgi:uncharacterized surface protein with fasciclin (FAS1) repeats
MKNLNIRILLVALMLTAANIQCSTGSKLLQSGSSLMNALGGVPNLSQITNILKTPGLDKLLGGALKTPFTLLAPTNDALNSMGSSAMSNLTNPNNINQLANMLKNYIVPGKKDATSIMESGLKAASGQALNLTDAASSLGSLIQGDKFNILPINKLLGGG